MIQSLFQYDRQLFGIINGRWANDFFDWLMPWLRNSPVWVPLYLITALFLLINFRKTGWIHIIVAVAVAGIANFISSDLIKENIYRLRPCNDASLADTIRVLVGYRPQSSSFTSSHAVNHFALATYLVIILKKELGRVVWLWWFWAFCICYAQVYVGVHYPLDVLAGAAIGILIGYLPGRWCSKRYSLQ